MSSGVNSSNEQMFIGCFSFIEFKSLMRLNSHGGPSLLGRFVNSLVFNLPSSSDFHSSDSDGHFDTPEEATPVHVPKTFPGELENSSADPHKTGEATAE